MRSWRSLIEWEPSEWLSIKRRFGAGAVTRVKWYSGLFILYGLYHWLGCAFDFTNTTTTHRVSACTQTRMCRNAGPPRGTVRVTSRERRASSGRVDYGEGGASELHGNPHGYAPVCVYLTVQVRWNVWVWSPWRRRPTYLCHVSSYWPVSLFLIGEISESSECKQDCSLDNALC